MDEGGGDEGDRTRKKRRGWEMERRSERGDEGEGGIMGETRGWKNLVMAIGIRFYGFSFLTGKREIELQGPLK